MKTNEWYMAKKESEQALRAWQKEADRNCPNFNDWVDKVDADKDYLDKMEKRLDDELGKDRIF